MKYQVVINRNDGAGWVLNGCWGSEEAVCDTNGEARELCFALHKTYPDCSWGFCPIVDDADTDDVTLIIEACCEDEDEDEF